MKTFTFLAFLFLSLSCHALDAEKLANAIYRAEGGAKARVPYGILSVKVSSEAEARRVCLNTIKNNHTRWIKAGKPGSYLSWLANRYCPKSADPVGHRNWLANVSRIYSASSPTK